MQEGAADHLVMQRQRTDRLPGRSFDGFGYGRFGGHEQEKQRPIQLERGRRHWERHVRQRQYRITGSRLVHREG
jgi:hypothetical protein